jgi:hypothetical protein
VEEHFIVLDRFRRVGPLVAFEAHIVSFGDLEFRRHFERSNEGEAKEIIEALCVEGNENKN